MDQVGKIIEAARNASRTSSTKSQGETSSKTALPKTWVSALFKRLQAKYLHKWTSAIDGIEETAVDEWSRGLVGITGEQIRTGLDSLSGEWPPTCEEFRQACLGNSLSQNEYGLNYAPEYHRPENRIRESSRLLSSDERDAKRKANLESLRRLRNELKI